MIIKNIYFHKKQWMKLPTKNILLQSKLHLIINVVVVGLRQ